MMHIGTARPRAAIYARFSTDLQNEKSSEDQIHLCKTHAKRAGYEVVKSFHDDARSGASIHGRPQLQELLVRANSGEFDVIVVEALDRLSRDMEDMAGIYKRLTYQGVKIEAVNDGEVNSLTVGMRALFAQLFREDNVLKVRRGMSGRVRAGQTAGGRAYGYYPDPANPGKPKIDETEAAIVLKIFEDYARGVSPKTICHRLNSELVKPPRGKRWSPSALHGAKARGSGILRNKLYAGRIVWNKVTMVRDPDTGKRISRANPVSEWQVEDAPDLRIIPQALFDAVQEQLEQRSHANRSDNMNAQRRSKRLLSGLLKCGACGAGMSAAGKDRSGRTRLRCSAHTNSRSCPDPKTFYLDEVEEFVIETLAKEMTTPDQIYTYATAYMEKLKDEVKTENARRTRIEARLCDISRKCDRLMDLASEGLGDEREHLRKVKELGAERDQLEQELSRLPQAVNVVVLPSAIQSFAKKLRSSRAKLHMALYLLDDMGELSRLIREVIDSITLAKNAESPLIIEVESWLGPFLLYRKAPDKALTSSGAVTLVAEEGLEPPTRGL